MQEILDKLKKWRTNRNMNDKDFILEVEVANLLEEYTEYLRAKNIDEQVDALNDMMVFSHNAMSYLKIDYVDTVHNVFSHFRSYTILQAISEMHDYTYDETKGKLFCIVILLCQERLESLGYDYDKTLLETIKEVSSRLQDPIQMKEWAENGCDGSKWQKDKGQAVSTLYKADYDSCKVGV